jgi:hypothetical protein
MNEDLRYRVKQLANEQLVMQEALHDLPLSEIRAHMKLMEQHAIKLSQLASCLYGDEHERRIRRENEIPLPLSAQPLPTLSASSRNTQRRG